MEKGEEEREGEEPKIGGAVCKRSVEFIFFFSFWFNLSELLSEVDVVQMKMREFEMINLRHLM